MAPFLFQGIHIKGTFYGRLVTRTGLPWFRFKKPPHLHAQRLSGDVARARRSSRAALISAAASTPVAEIQHPAGRICRPSIRKCVQQSARFGRNPQPYAG